MKNKSVLAVLLILSLFALGQSAERLVLAEFFTNAG